MNKTYGIKIEISASDMTGMSSDSGEVNLTKEEAIDYLLDAIEYIRNERRENVICAEEADCLE